MIVIWTYNPIFLEGVSLDQYKLVRESNKTYVHSVKLYVRYKINSNQLINSSKLLVHEACYTSLILYIGGVKFLVGSCQHAFPSFIYPYLTYGIVIWGNTYKSTLYPIVTLQKRAVRIITFSNFDEHSSPLFYRLKILKFVDLVFLYNSLFMHDYHFNNLSPSFKGFFSQVSFVHDHNTRTASKNTYYIDQIRTNYGRFSLRFQFKALKLGSQLKINLKLSKNQPLRKKLQKV